MNQPLEQQTEVKKHSRFAKCDPAWLTQELTGRELRVLLALSLHADWSATGHGRCFPKRDTLALTTGLQISHVSEAVRSLSQKHGLISVVRLGRKNIYYVRAIGEKGPMPPSDADPFFAFLGRNGIRLGRADDGHQIVYLQGSKKFNDFSPLLLAIFSDYVQGLIPERLNHALHINQNVLVGSVA